MKIKPRLLSIIIPLYREENNIRKCITESISFFNAKELIKGYEIIFVADRSGDKTIEIVRDSLSLYPWIRLIVNEQRLQKGGSIKVGVLNARYNDLYLFYDADLSTPLNEFDHLIRYIDKYDIVVGSRNLPTSQVEKSLSKIFVSKTLFIINKLLLGVSIKDTQCGFKLFSHRCRKLFAAMTIYSSAFDIELIYMAARAELKIKEIPIAWKDSETSNFNHLLVIGHFIRDFIRIRVNDLKGYYKTILN